uniref:AIG1-type G domain-containing protein n=1 Tax=Sphaeramia orbicularis TaxID=375764 RepID=A0A672Z333_9TELE
TAGILIKNLTFFSGLNSDDEIRIILIGKTGNGKSASGNTLLQREAFISRCAPRSVTSECEKAKGMVNGRRIAVIDTPGIYDTKYKEYEVVTELKKCISLSSPGPHAFLIVIKLDRFTEEEQKTVELLQKVFGDKAADYSMVLFTNGDQLQNTTIEEFTSQCPKLTHLIASCNGRYHVFNNRDNNIRQVSQLVNKIERMVITNGGGYYTNEMFREAERAIEEQKEKILKASEEQKRREEEILRAKLKGDELDAKLKWLDEEYERKAREKAEKKNKFIYPGMILTSAEVGLAIGVAAGTAGGPLFMGIGAVVGGLVGAAAGLIGPAAVVALKSKCTTQ